MGGYRRYDPNAKPEPFAHTRGERIVHAIELGAGLVIAAGLILATMGLIGWGLVELVGEIMDAVRDL